MREYMTIKVIIIEYDKNYNPVCENHVNKEKVEIAYRHEVKIEVKEKYWHPGRYSNDEFSSFHYGIHSKGIEDAYR
jgi:hypothetical protein